MAETDGGTHTPGPWDWDAGDIGHDFSIPYCTITAKDGDLIIAEINDRFDLNEGRANARLIAAAPETAAERDRLAQVNEELVAAMNRAAVAFEGLHADLETGISRRILATEIGLEAKAARAALARAREGK